MGGELDRYDSSSSSAQARGAALRRGGGHDSRERGFVLLFVLWTLTGIALLLALYNRTSISAPAVIEAQLDGPIAERQLYAAMDYVLWHLTEDTVNADARWVAQTRILRAERLERSAGAGREAKIRSALQQLKEILEQLEFEIELPDISSSIGRQKKLQEEIAQLSSVRLFEYQTPAEFRPQTSPHKLTIADESYEVMVRPAIALPNLNRIPPKPLARYLVYLGLEEDAAARLAAVIEDWRDEDGLRSELGADELYYRSLDPPYRPRDGAIRRWGELVYLKSASPALIELLRKNFMLHGNDWRVHPDYVPPAMIAALADLDLETVTRALDHLNSPAPGTRDAGLSGVIGLEAAQRFQSAISFRIPDDGVVLVEVTDGRSRLQGAFDTRTKELLDIYIE